MHKSVIFREYDIRGVVNQDYDRNFAYDLGRAYVTYQMLVKNKTQLRVSVGHDARHSSPELYRALIDGLKASGAHVVKLGLITSPISYFSTFHIPELDGAIMITGSHNPPEYNGFKISVGQSTIYGEAIQKLRQIIDTQSFLKLQASGAEQEFDIFPEYVKRYQSEFPQMSGVKVVLDPGNGAGGVIARRLFEACGIQPTIICEEPDGRFPVHHPDPTVEKNMELLKKTVIEQGAQVGIGFDGDADRIGIVDEKGRFILGDELMVILARDVLKQTPGGKIIGDVKCSDRFFADVTKHGGVPIMWKTGHSLVKEKIRTEQAPFGGEMSGHVFFRDRNYGYDDALYAGLRLCEILHKTKKSVSELLADLPPAYNTPELRIDTTEEKKKLIVEKLISFFQGQPYPMDLLDGVRVSFPDGWALARASNTQPVLVLRFEAQTVDSLKRIQDMVYSIVKPLL
ncbi:MAG: phosphomannomutase/phosphoglucomutase [Bdellovibrionaceae bacterium]|jgi:phosphomannomutase/phosphoglucomutase|nr:phosphomannomutase/phosphoglucomutase [Pseudobdellovibrionaceae bacterium]